MLKRNDDTDLLWRDPNHWTWLGLYRCAEDPRIWVPKQDPWMGWTLNIAHRSGRVILGSTLGVAVLIMVLSILLGSKHTSLTNLIVWPLLSLLIPIGIALWATRTRD